MYSQNEEEKYILDSVNGNGLFLDIGAYDGHTRSNTYELARRGWLGVLVEPSPKPFMNLVSLWGTNSRCRLIHSAVGLRSGLVEFWPSSDGVGTTESAHYETWKDTALFEPKVWVPQITVSQLMEEIPELMKANVVSIDTEGTSADLFIHWPFDMCKPKVFCVEYDNRAHELEEFAKTLGYKAVYESNENLVLVR